MLIHVVLKQRFEETAEAVAARADEVEAGIICVRMAREDWSHHYSVSPVEVPEKKPLENVGDGGDRHFQVGR